MTNETAITDANSGEIVAALRSISEILIWGDKNDPSVFEVFLEKHMLAYFVSILRQCDAVFAKPATHFQEGTVMQSNGFLAIEKRLYGPRELRQPAERHFCDSLASIVSAAICVGYLWPQRVACALFSPPSESQV